MRLLGRDVQPHAEHAWLLAPGCKRRGPIRLVERDPRHDAEAARITPRRLLSVVDALALERRRHDHDARDAGLIDQRHYPLDGEGLGNLRLRARHPRPVWPIGRPHVDLGIYDQPARLGNGGDCRRREREARAGGASEKAAA